MPDLEDASPHQAHRAKAERIGYATANSPLQILGQETVAASPLDTGPF